jgi:hypothetical protein
MTNPKTKDGGCMAREEEGGATRGILALPESIASPSA